MNKYLLLLPLICNTLVLKAQTDTVSNKISKIPFKHVDAIAKFPQGNFKTYIVNSLQTNHTVEYSIKGQIILLMGIGADGNVAHVSVLKSLAPQIDPEVVQVIKASPKWEPAKLNGQNVSMDMVLNIDLAVKGIKTTPVKPQQIRPVVLPTATAPVADKIEPPIIKKPAPIIAKKAVPPIAKNVAPVTAKPSIVKKPVAVIAKNVVPPIVKKPEPVIAKKILPPVVKKPAPVIAKKIVPTIVKKIAPVIAKKIEPPVKKTNPVIAKAAEKPKPVIAKQNAPATSPVKRKRVVMHQDLFNPSEHMAHFPGGDQNIAKFLGANIVYPPKSRDAGIQGRVVLTFVVEDDGTVDDVEVISAPSEDIGQEAIRVMLAMPKWKPAEQNKIKVPVSYTIPINFRLAEKTPEKTTN